MGLRTFKGGVHPYDGKAISKEKPIKELKPQGEMVYPLSQHIGAPATAIVAVGDTVLRGQKIADAGGFVSAPIFASVSGTVKAIEPRRVATGDMVNSIIIESDGKFIETGFEACDDYTELSDDQIISKIQNAGIVGMGGAGFPTHVKLSPNKPESIEFIIANCAECEPYLTSDYRSMVEEPEKLITGMKIILQLFPKAKGLLGIEDNKSDVIASLSKLCEHEPRIEVVPLMTKYPQGGERQLIKACTGREINSKMLPADAGCIVDNVATINAVYTAVVEGKPVMDRIFTVTGDSVMEPRNFRICIGTSCKEILEAAGGYIHEPKKIISGGPMMGFALLDVDVPTTKTSGALLCLSEDEVSKYETTACINCGRCVDACPENLIPSRLSKFADHGDKATFEKWYGLECIECGSCSFACPARKPLAQSIKTMKKMVLADKRKK
ncbi:MAG: electron transport complex subunit RsxC [Pseudobutyrivibrio sp.]|jgi:electron transport complex protein RnfC|uniref:Ion-translocating oxidoreductase complex subunit C n=1 Tax=Pseudobutyrivibrio ruminis TaxID=46206 RepID=A0A2G3EE07_9FIRM|nr:MULTISPECIES: electron transport complex subunit RsxC [Pseudobutyrivibrio]MBE5902691.1 electron transport complex subunit RsxC [Pseudobutyrivibrio sp.]PHU34979.1 electron transport complex subunit RsxC [Pseudobutyrivibrio ruminis]PHU41504.1 electron transport complex subunit RsxC [Pseudobutyrivibrio ruminis]